MTTVDPARRQGQVGEGWGNLLLADGESSVDDEFVFQGEAGDPPRSYVVKRVLRWPLDPARRLVYYERAGKRH